MVPSSTMVIDGAATRSPSLPTRNDALRYSAGPEAAPAMCRTSDAAMSGSKITGTSAVLTRRAPSRRRARRAAMRPISSGASRRARCRVT